MNYINNTNIENYNRSKIQIIWKWIIIIIINVWKADFSHLCKLDARIMKTTNMLTVNQTKNKHQKTDEADYKKN